MQQPPAGPSSGCWHTRLHLEHFQQHSEATCLHHSQMRTSCHVHAQGPETWFDLQVRLEHMLQRLRSLQDAAATSRPTRLLDHLYVSGAVEAASLHVLRHLGITHILNATEDLLQPDAAQNFV